MYAKWNDKPYLSQQILTAWEEDSYRKNPYLPEKAGGLLQFLLEHMLKCSN